MQQKRTSNQDMLEEGARMSREQERERIERREAREAMLQERLLQAEKEAEEVWGELEEEERMENREGGRGMKRRRVGSCMEGENRSWRTGDTESSGEEWEMDKTEREAARRSNTRDSEDADPSDGDEDEGIPARIPHNILKITTPLAVYEGISVRTHLMLLSLFCIASGNAPGCRKMSRQSFKKI